MRRCRWISYKAHLRLGTGFAEDDVQDEVLNGFLRAAIAAIEARTGKVLIERSFSWSLNGWRDPAGEVLPVAPVISVDGVAVVNAAGALKPCWTVATVSGWNATVSDLGCARPNLFCQRNYNWWVGAKIAFTAGIASAVGRLAS